MRILSLLVVLVLAIGSCKPKTVQKPFGKDPALENRRWTLRELMGAPYTVPEGGKDIFLSFEGQSNTFGGNTGCNQVNGMYTVHEDMIYIRRMELTEMACKDMKPEQQFLQVLDTTNRYTLEVQKTKGVNVEFLNLYRDQQRLARFEAVWLN
jgi:heat shock protein HslJ